MGYFLPIRDYQGEQYKRRIVGSNHTYQVDRTYRVVFHKISNDNQADRKLTYVAAQKSVVKRNEKMKKRRRFTSGGGKVAGKGEHINMQI